MDESLRLKIDSYSKLLNSGELKLEMNFVNSTSEMNMGELRTEFCGNINDYSVVELNVNKVVSQLGHDGEIRYPLGKLIVDYHTVGVIELIEQGTEIIPPEIRFINNGLWKVIDGQHRISLMRYLKLKSAKFLVRTNNLSFCKELK
jgi:hypothetical protein